MDKILPGPTVRSDFFLGTFLTLGTLLDQCQLVAHQSVGCAKVIGNKPGKSSACSDKIKEPLISPMVLTQCRAILTAGHREGFKAFKEAGCRGWEKAFTV